MSLYNKCDVHTHTLFSRHAYGTIQENVTASVRNGLELLGSADHFSSMLFPDYEDHRNYQYVCSTKDWPRLWDGITLLRGIEADIVDADGHLFGEDIPVMNRMTGDRYMDDRRRTLYTWATDRLDYVIASVHGKDFTDDLTPAQTTRMYLRAMEREDVLMLGHIGRTGLDIDVDEILQAARALHKPIEINEHSFQIKNEASWARCRRIAERCAELGVMIAVTTDAHMPCNVGSFAHSIGMLEEIGFPQELIATRDKETFLLVLKESLGRDIRQEG